MKTKPKTKPISKVGKALSSEEATLLSNIKSMISELESIGAGEAAMAEDEEVDPKVIIPEDEEDEEFTAPPMKSAEGPTANDDADERLEETDPESEKNISAVKALIRRMDSSIKKSSGSNQTLLQAVVGLTRVVKSLSDRIDQQETAMVHVLNGIGIGEEIEKAIQPVNSKKPVQATDTRAVLKSLLGLVEEEKPQTTVRKSLADKNILTQLLT